MTTPWHHLFEGFFEIISNRGVDDEVDGSVDDEERVVDTGQAEVPVGGNECVRTGEDGVQHEQLCTVEDDPGDVADDEHDHNADEDSGQVQLPTDSSISGLVVSVSVNKPEIR